MFHVYLIESESSGKWYIGYTNDLKRRLREHNNHKNISTANESKWKLIYCETYVDKMDAIGREKFLKSGSGRKFLKNQIRNFLAKKLIKQKSTI
ncbi:GIY-YIG nuclease family protein [Candidatus Peribacteria bacterium]|nr:GIY-YIG nuclease family protein [Candidatus Peribacteria bacterium]MBT4021091.1 GIY-YIG nuclease family protein [Candidatus Peribacteria bacterium]MBT4240864.1 GIY-YIG nuclease family protein [Candidatus Peribacteria bacterium]MBT4473754.1 GIY-YIG nuclease family protein [Candidatus Peribacteria bacterium]